FAAVIADAIYGDVVVDYSLVVNMHIGDVDVVHRAVVVERAAAPISANVADAKVAETVVHATVEADVRSPVSRVPKVEAFTPTPVAWRPKEPWFRGDHPRARHPEITVFPIRPVAGRPDVAITRASRLHIHRQYRRRDADRNKNPRKRQGGNRQDQ